LGAAMAWVQPARAQGLVDPTRPPPEFAASTAGKAVSPVPGGGQIIILSRERKEVTVNGQTAKLGGKLGEATVIDITDSRVTTRKGAAVGQINLYDEVDKRMALPQEGRLDDRNRSERGMKP